MSNRSPNSPSPPQWEVLALLAHHLDPKSLGVASCVSKSWHTCMASDHIWQPFCTSHYPSLSNLKITHPLVSYHRLYAMAYVAAKLRARDLILGANDYEFLSSVNGMLEDVRITWNVVLKDWSAAFTMMDYEGKVRYSPGSKGWFSQELPRPRCCSGDSTSGIVADLKLEFCSDQKDCGGKVRVDKVSVGILNVVDWRYVIVEDGIRYLQHFLFPC
ncbi:F-BOX ONLY PROTEIN 48-RELATED [Salix viminalis]|uniref:F-box protein n=1 Tax=Salix viminalis TaxID=40686 RepID=A0A9Q0V5W5_SALVM|nr:F-BOX ONLY PROTEIN 48-RELATED [Salix viminalis]